MSTVKGLELASLYQLDLEVAKRLEAEVFLKVRDSFNPMPDIPIGRGRRPVDPQPLSPLTMDADEDPATFHIRSRAHQEETEARKLSYDTATFGYVGALEWAYAFQLRYDLELESRFNTASYESHRMATMANASTSGVTTRGDASKTSHKNNDVETAIDANGVHFVRRQPACYPCVTSGSQCLTVVGRELERCWFCVKGDINCDEPNPYAAMCDSLRQMEPWLERLGRKATEARGVESAGGGFEMRVIEDLVQNLAAQGNM